MAKRYSPKLKFQVVKEVLQSGNKRGKVARAYGVHSNSVSNWEATFNEKGPEIFEKDGTISEYERRIAHLEQLLGKKEVEIALLKKFLGQDR